MEDITNPGLLDKKTYVLEASRGELIAVEEAIWQEIRFLRRFPVLTPSQRIMHENLMSFLQHLPKE